MKKLFLMLALFLGMSFNGWAKDLELGTSYSYEQVEGSYDDIYADFTYTASEDGVLVFTSDASLSGYASVDEGDEVYVNFTSPDYTNYFLKYPVKAGSTYDFTFKTWKSFSVSAEMTHPTVGSGYDLPFQANLGEQTLPAAAGTYWYKVTPGKEGYLHVSSESLLVGGKVTIASVGYDGTPSTWTCKSSEVGNFDVLMSIDSYTSYFVKVEKATATDAEQSFTIAWEDFPVGTSDSNPIMISEMPFTGSAPVGTTYYGLSITNEDAGKMIVMSATTTLQSDWSNCSAYPQSNSYDQTYGDASVEVVAKEGVMILKWVNYEEQNLPFTVSMKTLLPGQTIETPIVAQVGDNDFAEAGTWFYTYTAGKDGKLIVTPSDASIKVTFPKGSGPYDGFYGFSKTGDDYSIAVTEGLSYLLKFEYATDESWFTIAEGEFQQGEVRENPIEVSGDTYTFGAAQSVWIAYTADKDGKLTITCDAEPSYANQISIWTPGANYGESLSSYDDNYNMVYSKTIMVKAGDVILVNPVMANNEAGKKICFSIAEPQPGETFANPLMAKMDTQYDVPSINYGSPYWFKLHLAAGDYRFYASDYIGAYYYGSEAKAVADEEDYDDSASLSQQDEDGNSYFAFTIAEETDVYFKITRSWGAFQAWFTSDQPAADGLKIVASADAENISIEVSDEEATYFYALLDEYTINTWAGIGISSNEMLLTAYMNMNDIESNDDLFQGSVSCPTADLELEDGKYVFVVGGVKFDEDEEMVFTTEVQRFDFTIGGDDTPDEPAAPVTFDMAVSGLDVTVTPSDEEATYCYVVLTDEIMEALETSSVGEAFDMLANAFNELQSGEADFNVLGDYLEFLGIEELEDGTELTLVVAECKKNEEKEIVRCGDMFAKTFTYSAEQPSVSEFDIVASADAENISIEVSDEEATYFYALLDEYTINTWAGIGISSNEMLLTAYMNMNDIESNDDLFQGSVSCPTADLELEDGKYVFVVGGVKFDEDEEMVFTTEVQRFDFTIGGDDTPDEPAAPVTFDMAVSGLDVTVTPSDEEATYCYAILTDEIMELFGHIGITETADAFEALANMFYALESGEAEFNILEDYLEYLGIEELEDGTELTLIVAECQENEDGEIVRCGDMFTKTFTYGAAAQNIDIVLGAGGYSTVAATSNFIVPQGVEAYYATVSAGKVFLHKVESDVIAAGEGIILKGEAGQEICLETTDEEAELIEGNKMVGVTDPSTFENNGNVYVIATQADETAFYKYTADTFVAGKAYLNAEGATSVKMSVSFADATTISGIATDEAGKAIFNLQGQRIQKAQKGINIVNGRKYIVK